MLKSSLKSKIISSTSFICATLVLGASICNAEVADMNRQSYAAYERLKNTTWSLGNLPCEQGGGTLVEYGDYFKDGFRFTLNGKAQIQSEVPKKFYFVQSEELGSLNLVYEYYANEMLIQMGFPADGVVSRGFRRFTFDGEKLIEEHHYQSIDLDAFLKDYFVSYERMQSELVERTPCNAPLK